LWFALPFALAIATVVYSAYPPPEAEADTWAGLLDALQTQRLAVIAFSTGAGGSTRAASPGPSVGIGVNEVWREVSGFLERAGKEQHTAA
jgi:pimeloyl-ACP methyl ester carboxylesterase